MILVINAPFVKDFCRTQRWAARTRGRVLRAPDWLAYATAVLEEAGEDVRFYDFPARGWGKQDLASLARRLQPDFLLLDGTTPSIFSDFECARLVKDSAPGCKVIMVGPHPTALPEQTLLESNGSVDVVAMGEYDYTIRDIVSSWDSLESVPGIAMLDGDSPTRTAVRAPISDLDALPFPAWKHLNLLDYYSSSKLHPHANMISGRGCPFRCTFCLWPQVMHGHEVRLRSAANVVDEMEYDLALEPKLARGEFFFEDDTFTANKEHAIAICEEIMRRNLEVTWSVDARVTDADPELFGIMKRAGCREFCVGFESGDDGVLRGMRKGITVARSRRFVEIARAAGIKVHGCFVLGMPGETRSTMGKTLDLSLELGLNTAQFAAAVPFPGTAYYDYCQSEGLLHANSWADWLDGGEQSSIITYPGLSASEVNAAVDRGLKNFYFRPTYMLRFLLDTRDVSDLRRKLRSASKFLGYLTGR